MSTVTYNLGAVALIPLGEGRLFEAGRVTIAVFRTRAGQVHATEPWCPHRGGPLADGIVASGKVVCPLHGYMFELATGAPVHHECRRLRTYDIRLNADDELLVTMRRDSRRGQDGRQRQVADASEARAASAAGGAGETGPREAVAIDG